MYANSVNLVIWTNYNYQLIATNLHLSIYILKL